MGLQEKVWIKRWQDQGIPTLQKHIKEQCGGDVAIEVDWNTVAVDINVAQHFEGTALNPIRDAVYTICRTEVGKGALKDGLKKITLKNVTDPNERQASMKEGVLSLTAVYNASAKTEQRFNDHQIQAVIEQAL
jgi:hypothetical protein